MGIFNNGGKFNNLISAIQSIKENPVFFTSCQHSRITLSAGVKTLIVPQTPIPKIRRITMKNAGLNLAIIFKGESNSTNSAFDILPGERLCDEKDGGIIWYALSPIGSILDIAIEEI